MYHRRHVATSVDIWHRELRKASSARKLSFIYLCNDVCQNSRRKGPEFIQAFKKVLPEAIEHAYRHAVPHVQNSITRVINIWDEREVFDHDFIDQLRENLTGQKSITKTKEVQPDQSNDLPPNFNRPEFVRIKLATTTKSIVDLELVIHESSNKVSKFWTEVMEVEEKPRPSILSIHLDHLQRILNEHESHIKKQINNRTNFIIQMKEIISQEETKLRLDNKNLTDIRCKIDESKELIEQLKAITVYQNETTEQKHSNQVINSNNDSTNDFIQKGDDNNNNYYYLQMKANNNESSSVNNINNMMEYDPSQLNLNQTQLNPSQVLQSQLLQAPSNQPNLQLMQQQQQLLQLQHLQHLQRLFQPQSSAQPLPHVTLPTASPFTDQLSTTTVPTTLSLFLPEQQQPSPFINNLFNEPTNNNIDNNMILNPTNGDPLMQDENEQ
ncbi:17104_t:CDS:2 [Entrophospora sp. SA101]|nr:17104_t:CDS:2 [Entrophospora sp. SA101]